jgi:FAD/FMN-containing dehydrogenase
MELCGWGRHPVIDAEVSFPASRSAAVAAVAAGAALPMIARGMGRSYGDSALAARVVSSRYLNLLHDFDPAVGRVRCGAGVTLAELLEVFVPRGWFLPVTPGTRFVSVGGAIGSDAHGKNHHGRGCFSECLERFELVTASGEVLACSREEHPDLFRATCGGMGLTGLILEATLKLAPLASAYVEERTVKCANLEEALATFESCRGATYSVAWIDCQATGSRTGRSLVMLGEHAADGTLHAPGRRRLAVPVDLPGPLLNAHSIRAFNALYYHRVRARQSSRRLHYEAFFYPLDRLENWNRLYGKGGFTQYQFVIPKAAGTAGVSAILRRIAASGRGSFLAVLKLLGPENANYLSFPLEGYTLALDFKLEPGLFELLDELDARVHDHGGRVYLAKDCRLGAAGFRRGYPRWEAFQAVRERYGARGRFGSLQSERIGLG